jgi:hypothetical protein
VGKTRSFCSRPARLPAAIRAHTQARPYHGHVISLKVNWNKALNQARKLTFVKYTGLICGKRSAISRHNHIGRLRAPTSKQNGGGKRAIRFVSHIAGGYKVRRRSRNYLENRLEKVSRIPEPRFLTSLLSWSTAEAAGWGD